MTNESEPLARHLHKLEAPFTGPHLYSVPNLYGAFGRRHLIAAFLAAADGHGSPNLGRVYQFARELKWDRALDTRKAADLLTTRGVDEPMRSRLAELWGWGAVHFALAKLPAGKSPGLAVETVRAQAWQFDPITPRLREWARLEREHAQRASKAAADAAAHEADLAADEMLARVAASRPDDLLAALCAVVKRLPSQTIRTRAEKAIDEHGPLAVARMAAYRGSVIEVLRHTQAASVAGQGAPRSTSGA